MLSQLKRWEYYLYYYWLFFLEKLWRPNKQDLESAVIEYNRKSRGFYQKITVQNQMVTISKDRSGQDKAVATK
jgi:hypothetical protein